MAKLELGGGCWENFLTAHFCCYGTVLQVRSFFSQNLRTSVSSSVVSDTSYVLSYPILSFQALDVPRTSSCVCVCVCVCIILHFMWILRAPMFLEEGLEIFYPLKQFKPVIRLVHIFISPSFCQVLTERRGRVVNTPPYSGCPRFKSRSGDLLSWQRFLCFFSVPPGKYQDSTLKLCHARFLPNLFQFMYLSPFYSTLYNWKSVVK
jgi:hypothetical protein